jgi:small subunit ribosomal protein S12
MVTYNQLLTKKQKRIGKPFRTKTPALRGCPQKKGIAIRVYIEKPKKPNSAKRRIIKLRLTSTKKKTRATVPGPHDSHNIKPYSRVLIRGGRTRDLIGLKYRVVVGVYDCRPVFIRKTSRSKYGVKRAYAVR